jgi:hypothetical protein
MLLPLRLLRQLPLLQNHPSSSFSWQSVAIVAIATNATFS